MSSSINLAEYLASSGGIEVNVVKSLILSQPYLLLSPDLNGSLPIHLALSKNFTVEIIQELAQCAPTSLRVFDKNGLAPIDISLCCQTEDGIAITNIFLGIDADLLTFRHPDSGKNAFHRIFECSSITPNIDAHYKLIVDICGRLNLCDAFMLEDNQGRHPLMTLVSGDNATRTSAEITYLAMRILKIYPALASVDSVRRRTLFHVVLERVLSESTITIDQLTVWIPLLDLLVELAPSCTAIPFFDGSFPVVRCLLAQQFLIAGSLLELGVGRCGKISLVDCCSAISDTNCPDKVADMLVDNVLLDPSSVSSASVLTLLTAAIRSNRRSICDKLIIARPEIVTIQNAGDFPLHIAICSCASESLVSLLIESFPDALIVLSSEGKAPLAAMIQQAGGRYSLPFLVSCVQRYPTAAKVFDVAGELPIHRTALPFLMNALLDAYPEGACAPSAQQESVLQKMLLVSDTGAPTSEVLLRLVALHPDGCKRSQQNGSFPLHEAVRTCQPVPVVEAIASVYPEAIMIQDMDNRFPIHVVLDSTDAKYSKQQQVDIILLFIRLNDNVLTCRRAEMASSPSSSGFCPLHVIVKDRGFDRFDLVPRILSICPAAASMLTTSSGMLPIHLALQANAPISLVATLISTYPEGLRVRETTFGDMPLHACVRNSSMTLDILDCLIEAYPLAASVQDKIWECPLHCAVRSLSSSSSAVAAVIHRLLDIYPDAVKQADCDNNLPLHRALESTVSSSGSSLSSSTVDAAVVGVILRLIRMYPDGCKKKNNRNDLALHDAVRSCLPIEVIEALTDVSSEAIIVKDKDNADPIHMIFGGNYSKQKQARVVMLFIRMNPKAALCQDKDNGFSPLHMVVKDRSFDEYRLAEDILAARPECASIRCARTSDLAIHLALQAGAPLAIVAALSTAYPDGLKVKDSNGELPLHCCVRGRGSLEVVRFLIESYPASVQCQDKDLELALHISLRSRCDNAVIHALLDAYPDACRVVDKEKDYPLHRGLEAVDAAGGLSDPQIVLRMMRFYPDACKRKNREGRLPLHDGILMGMSMEVIEAITDIYPEAIITEDNKGTTPVLMISSTSVARRRQQRYSKQDQAAIVMLFVRMHIKAASHCPSNQGTCCLHVVVQDRGFDAFNLVEQIVTARPDSARVQSRSGLALHLAVKCRAPPQQIAALIAAYPEGLRVKDANGDISLHNSVRNTNIPNSAAMAEEVFVQLLEGYPGGASVQDNSSEIPLHVSLRSRCSTNIITRLLTAYPDGVRLADSDKCLPLHRGLEAGAMIPAAIITRMVSIYPDGCKKKNSKGDLPLHDAIRSAMPVGVVEALCDVFPDAIVVRDKLNADPIHLIVESSGGRYSKEDQAKLILLFIRMNGKAASCQDGTGLCPLHVVVKDRAFDCFQLVESILSVRPECASIRCASGSLPIHFAIQSRAPLSQTAALIAAFPDGLKTRNQAGDLPLHECVRNSASVSLQLLTQLLQGYPAGVGVQDKEGLLPLHFSLRSRCSDVVINQLLDAFPDGVRVADSEKLLPMHVGLETAGTSTEVLIRLVQMYPDGCKKKNSKGDLPLHDAIRSAKPIAVIEALCDVYPDAIVMRDKENADPIHLVLESSGRGSGSYSKQQQAAIVLLFIRMNGKAASCQSKELGLCPLHMVVRDRGFDAFQLAESILNVHPDSASVKCRNGNVAIHFALQSRAPLSQITALIAAFPDGLKVKDNDGDIPLHFCVRNHASLDVVIALIEGFPGGAGVQDKQSELPIHYALRSRCSAAIIHRLLDTYPDGVTVADNQRNLPLHQGLEIVGTPSEVLLRIISMYPDSCKKKNRRHDLPLHDCVRSGASFEVISALADVYPDAITMRDKENADPIHLILEARGTRYSKQQQAEIVLLFVRMNNKAAGCQDKEAGLCPLHVVVKDRGFDNFKLAESMVTMHPSCASLKCASGDLAIHLAVQTRAPLSLIAALIAAYPDGLKVRDREGLLPLHFAVRNNLPLDTITQLVEGYRGALSVPDRDGEIPAMKLIRRNGFHNFLLRMIQEGVISPAKVVDSQNCYLIKAAVEDASWIPGPELMNALCAPDARAMFTTVATSDGMCAFSLMCQHWQQCGPMCLQLLDRYSTSLAGARGRDGQGGLHKLLRAVTDFSSSFGALTLALKLIEVNPNILLLRDTDLQTPLAYLVRNSVRVANINVLRAALVAKPQALTQLVDGRGSGSTLLDEARSSSHVDVVRELLGRGCTVRDISQVAGGQGTVGQVLTTFRQEVWLRKKGGIFGIWRRRCFKFLASASACLYFESASDVVPKGIIGLLDARIQRSQHIVNGFEVQTSACSSQPNRVYVLQAENASELETIIAAFNDCIRSTT